MNIMRMTTRTTLALALAAGLATSATAQNRDLPTSSNPSGTPARDGQPPRTTPETRERDERNDRNVTRAHVEPKDAEARLAGCDFRSYKWMNGLDIFNPSGDHVADVSDLIINRGTGQIDSVVVSTGTTLGLGGKTIAVPYSLLRWDGVNSRFMLDATEDQLKTYPEFSKENWAGLTDRDAKKPNALRDWMRRHEPDFMADPYAGSLEHAKTDSIDGEITRIDRVDSGSGEQIVATVRDTNGNEQRVWLGPSWFVNGSTYAPMRGDKVRVEAYTLERSPENAYVARSMRVGENELAFRSDSGGPLWSGPARDHKADDRDARSLDDATYASPSWRSILASELAGRKAVCRGQDSGKVSDLIVDRASGQVAMLSIDPNENFLGIADTKRLVPWDVATVAVDGTVRIDASKEMVLASPDTPSDMAKLNNGATAKMVYKAYDIDVPSFRKADRQSSVRDVQNDAWSSRGEIVRGFARGQAQHIDGEVVEITRVEFDDGTSPAKAVKVRTHSGVETVLLGPAAYCDTQKDVCTKGKNVAIDAVRVRIDGKDRLLARSITTDGNSVTMIDGTNIPAWDKR